jgi:hypothetical protein
MAMVGHEMRGSFCPLIGQSTNTTNTPWKHLEYRIYNNALFTVSSACVYLTQQQATKEKIMIDHRLPNKYILLARGNIDLIRRR